MTNQVVNTEEILAVAQTLTTINSNIQSHFDTVEKKANTVATSWNSTAASKAETLQYQMKKSNEARSTVLENYINVFTQTISPNYIATEDANISLAEQFL